VSSVFGKYGSQVPKFGTASNDVTNNMCIKWGMVVKEHNKKPEKDDLE
jgi:hypothetical protein